MNLNLLIWYAFAIIAVTIARRHYHEDKRSDRDTVYLNPKGTISCRSHSACGGCPWPDIDVCNSYLCRCWHRAGFHIGRRAEHGTDQSNHLNDGHRHEASPMEAMTGVTTTPIPTGSTLVTPSSAPSQYDCNFEQGLCSWTQDKTDQFDWTRKAGGTQTSGTGPSTDHTIGSSSGHYIFIEASFPRRLNDTARIISASVTTKTTKCLHFWYHMYGTHVNTLNVYLKVGSQLGNPVWTHTGTLSNKWYNANVDIMKSTNYNIVFEGVRGTSYRGDIGLDDISVKEGSCSGGGVCDFEDPQICGYTQDRTDDFDWTRQSGRTSSASTGPFADHTYGTKQGSYMFTKAFAPRTRGQKARLVGQSQPSTTGSCLQFYYHMFGSGMGTLNMYARTGNAVGNPVWTKSGNQGNRWIRARVTVTSQSSWQPTFEGIIGPSYQSDIAIDDIQITNGACSGSNGGCDFENDMCTWANTRAGDNFDWLRKSGSTQSISTGPASDHTIGTFLGHYVYIETSAPRVKGDKAWLLSQSFNSFSIHGRCMSFWYHMYGAGIGTLNVYQNKTGSSPTLLWTLSGNQGNQWSSGKLPISTSTTGYQIYFEGIRGQTYSGDIALDDISFSETGCGYQPVNANPAVATTLSTTPGPLTTSKAPFDDSGPRQPRPIGQDTPAY